AAAEATRASWELVCAWRLDLDAIEQYATEDARAFLSWARRFRQLGESENWLESARWPDRLLSILDQIPLPAHIVLAGFDELTPQQSAFIEACRQAAAEVQLVEPPRQPATDRWRIAFPDRAREFEAAARWARALIEFGRASSVAIILPDLEAVRSQLERIFLDVLDPSRLLPGPPSPSPALNIAAPPPLLAHSLVRAALLALELDPERNSFSTVSRLLRSGFFMSADSERAHRARLEFRIRELGLPELSIARLRRLCRRLAPKAKRLRLALRRWEFHYARLPERQLPSAWAQSFPRLLHALGWPGERALSSDEFQALAAWDRVLARFARLDRVSGPITRSQALAQLRRLLA
ncbi:MAG: hypothetical protein ACPL88_13115, partial [Bryobacteraceae bacterium]